MAGRSGRTGRLAVAVVLLGVGLVAVSLVEPEIAAAAALAFAVVAFGYGAYTRHVSGRTGDGEHASKGT